MKKILCILMVMALCMTAMGCRAAQTDPDGSETTTAPTPAETTDPTVEETLERTEGTENDVTIPTAGEEDETVLAFENPGKVRITYEGNRSYVKYITDPSELPDHEELKQYDAAFFRDHALILVVETLNSGSVKVDIGSITVKGGVALVALSREMQGDVGTTDMATWMLWAEVEAGLDYQWKVKNPSVKPSGETY